MIVYSNLPVLCTCPVVCAQFWSTRFCQPTFDMDVKMTKKDVSTYLEKKGVPDVYCKAFEGMLSIADTQRILNLYPFYIENYVDGCAFMMLSEKDVRELVPPTGLIKKIMSFIPKVSC